MSKSLKVIQTFAKIAKVISRIGFIGCIIGVVGCLIGIIGTACLGSLVIGGKPLISYIMEYGEMSRSTMMDAMCTGLFTSAGGIVVTRFSLGYFKKEIKDGTPFTESGAKEMLRLGIITAAVPLAAMILAQIAHAVFVTIDPQTAPLELENGTTIGLGITFIVLSFILRYGAELNEQKAKAPTEEENV